MRLAVEAVSIGKRIIVLLAALSLKSIYGDERDQQEYGEKSRQNRRIRAPVLRHWRIASDRGL